MVLNVNLHSTSIVLHLLLFISPSHPPTPVPPIQLLTTLHPVCSVSPSQRARPSLVKRMNCSWTQNKGQTGGQVRNSDGVWRAGTGKGSGQKVLKRWEQLKAQGKNDIEERNTARYNGKRWITRVFQTEKRKEPFFNFSHLFCDWKGKACDYINTPVKLHFFWSA